MATSYIAGTPYVGANVVYKAGPGGHRGVFTAWDPVAAKAAWTIKETFPVWSGTRRDRRRRRVLRDDGRLVQGGGREDRRAAVAVQDAAPESSASRSPTAARRQEYVAILAGVGGWAGAIVADDLDPRDATAGKRLWRA